MSAKWKQIEASEIRPGDRIRRPDGSEMQVSRIESPFMGRTELIALIEDEPERWFKLPVPTTMQLEVLEH
jgi:hypothetical protein